MKQKIQIALVVLSNGEWAAVGGSWLKSLDDAFSNASHHVSDAPARIIIEADVDFPNRRMSGVTARQHLDLACDWGAALTECS
jgi:hypothetical protein